MIGLPFQGAKDVLKTNALRAEGACVRIGMPKHVEMAEEMLGEV